LWLLLLLLLHLSLLLLAIGLRPRFSLLLHFQRLLFSFLDGLLLFGFNGVLLGLQLFSTFLGSGSIRSTGLLSLLLWGLSS
jgi:hypothetical protein